METVFDKPLDTELSGKQNATDNTLTTTAKTVVGAINENASGISSNSTAITKWASRHSASDIGTITSLSALQSTLKTLADALALYETKYFFVTINFSGTFEYYNTVYTGEITYITPDRYNVLMQNHTNASQIYRGACASGTWSWAQLVTKENATISTLILEQQTFVTGENTFNCNWSNYNLLLFDIGNYANSYQTLVIPKTEFALTSNGHDLRLSYGGGAQWVVYKASNTSVTIYAPSSIQSNTRIRIWGIM